jgi:hypothetical protein
VLPRGHVSALCHVTWYLIPQSPNPKPQSADPKPEQTTPHRITAVADGKGAMEGRGKRGAEAGRAGSL